MQIVTGRRGEPHVTSRQMQAVYRSFLGDFALLDIGEKLRAEAYSNDIVRVYDGVVSVQGIYAVIAYNQYDEVYIEPVSVGKKRIDTIVLHYTKDNALDVEDMQLDVVQGEEYTDNPIAPVVPEGGDAWEGTTDIQVPIYDVEVTNFGLTVTPYARMLNLIPTLESIAERIPETVVTGVKGDSEVLYRDGDVNITKANIGLENVDNTADTDKPISTATQTALNLKADLTYVDAKISAAYHAGGSKTVAELTSALLIADNIGKVYNMSDSGVTTSDFVEGAGKSINEGDNVGICNVGTEESPVYKFDLLSGFVDLSAYATTSALNDGLAGKVDKVTGKGLSTEDYTTTDKTKLAGIEAQANKTVVDSAMSDSSTNPLQNKVITKELEGSKTATGNPLTIEDAAPVNAVNLSMDLEPVQDLHGYDHPWVGGAGKNLYVGSPSFDGYSQISGWTKQTETYNGHDVYKRNSRWGGAYKAINLATGTYTFSAMVKVGSACNIHVFALLENVATATLTPENKTVSLLANTWTRVDFTFEVTTAGKLALRVENGNNDIDTYISEYQLEAGNQATSYADYENICPISGRSEVAIDRVGKNLFDGKNSGYAILSDGTLGINNDVVTSDYIPVIQGNYYLTNVIGSAISRACAVYDSNKSFVRIVTFPGTNTASGTITIESDEAYIRCACSASYKDSCQVEKGNTATTYEPYAGKTYTIQLGDTVYGGQLDVTRGKMVVTHGEVDLGDLDYYYNSADTVFYSLLNNIGRRDNSMCSQYVLSNVTTGASLGNGMYMFRLDLNRVYIKDTRYTNATAFKTAVTGQTLVYELATPFTIDLTPQQIKMLENINTIYTDYEGDTITIEYQPNNAIGEAVRVVEESYDPEFAVRPPLKKKAFSGTTDSDGAVTLINASDIPSGHKIIPLHITDMTIDGNAGTYFVEYKPYNSGDAVKGYCYFYMSGSQMFPVGKAITGNFYYYELEV